MCVALPTSLDKLQALEEPRQEPDAGAPEIRTDDLFIHPRKLLPSIPSVTATDDTAARLRHGQSVNLPDTSRAREVKVFQGQCNLIAIATRIAGTLFHPKIVLR